MSETFLCELCGKVHDGLPTDRAFQLPDDVWAIPEQERSERAQFTADLCAYDDRQFIRCVLYVPFTESTGAFGWGVWIEVDRSVFERYLALYESDGSGEPRYPGKLANVLPPYDEALGANVFVEFGDSTQRPSVHLPPGADSRLALEQRHGIDSLRYHEILSAIGVLS